MVKSSKDKAHKGEDESRALWYGERPRVQSNAVYGDLRHALANTRTMFIDEITIEAKAGDGGNGVVRWLRERSRPMGGPAGGNGGKGGSVFMRAVRDNGVLSKYTGSKVFNAPNGQAGYSKSRFGMNGEDLIIDVPVGSVVTNLSTGRTFELFTPGTVTQILRGGMGGLGNEHFKSSTNRSPVEHTPGKPGEWGSFRIEVELVVDVGIIGQPNAGKSTLLNAMTRAQSRVASYPFTTLEPHLGDLFGFILADIPGLIEGAAEGKGLGHKFLRHVKRTHMIIHCISCEHEDPLRAYEDIRNELGMYDASILEKVEWIVLTKTDLVPASEVERRVSLFKKKGRVVLAVSEFDMDSVKVLSDALVKTLREQEPAAADPVPEK